jgi:phosphatidylcholine synthase
VEREEAVVLPDFGHRAAAVAVHIFTASGIVCALMAMLAAIQGIWTGVFAWLGLALFIDGVDGTLARAVDIRRRLPRFSGEQLDLVIDYVTYVFIPAVVLHLAGLLPAGWGIVLSAMILLSSLYHFSDTASKTDDHCFVGFPAIWNIVAFYLFAFALPPWVCACVILLCVGLTFIPMRWVHPLRVEKLRAVTVGMMLAWSLAAFAVLWNGFAGSIWWRVILGAVAAYGIALSVLWPWADQASREKA